jgi:hypothetical protein
LRLSRQVACLHAYFLNLPEFVAHILCDTMNPLSAKWRKSRIAQLAWRLLLGLLQRNGLNGEAGSVQK